MNEQVLSKFGRPVTYTPAAAEPFTVAGIVEMGARPEDAAPDVYALLFVRAASGWYCISTGRCKITGGLNPRQRSGA